MGDFIFIVKDPDPQHWYSYYSPSINLLYKRKNLFQADVEVFCNFSNIRRIINESILYILKNHSRVEFINHNSWLYIDNEAAKVMNYEPDGRYLTQEGFKKVSDRWIEHLNKIIIETPPREMNTVHEAVDRTVHPAQAKDDEALFIFGNSMMMNILDAVELKHMFKIPVFPKPAMNFESLYSLTLAQALQPSQKKFALIHTLQSDIFNIALRSECSAEDKHEMTKELALDFCDFIDELLSESPQLEIIISDLLPGFYVIPVENEVSIFSFYLVFNFNSYQPKGRSFCKRSKRSGALLSSQTFIEFLSQ